MTPEELDALADRVAERVLARLGDRVIGAPRLLTTAEVARRLGVSAEYVREHAEDLGVVRLGGGRKPRLRFDARRVEEAATARSQSRGSERATSSAARRHPPPLRAARGGQRPGLLPVGTVKSPDSDKAGERRANGLAPATRAGASPRSQPTPTGRGRAAAGRSRASRRDREEP